MARPRNNPEGLAELPTALRTDRPKGDQIRALVEQLTRTLAAGTALPSERVLAERFGVARMTVRLEVDRVVAKGLAVRRPGGGTFVVRPRAARPLSSSFSRTMRARGLTPGAKVLDRAIAAADETVAAELEEPPGTPVLSVSRLRTADGRPVAIERTHLSLRRYPGLDDLDLGATASLYDELAARWGVKPGLVNASIAAAPAGAADAELLDVGVGTPCLVVTSAPRSASGQVIESSRSLYRTDRYDLTIAYHTNQ